MSSGILPSRRGRDGDVQVGLLEVWHGCPLRREVVSLYDNKIKIHDGWWCTERYTHIAQEIFAKLNEVLETDLAQAAVA